ncbi:unnamed protein product [Schistosoma curassoni]|uniref:Ovule protein n=1 Tax=Schistosoma curassoni TaxID=6186 RepID=A0A183KYT1_9TREM|nr:unnamed protein product [Schistosoma curassoni]
MRFSFSNSATLRHLPSLNSDGILKYESLLTLKILKSLESESDSRTADRVAHILQLALQTSIPNIFPTIC